MQTIALLESVQSELQQVEIILRDVAKVEHQGLAFLLSHLMENRGKRLRPAIVLLAAKFGSYAPEQLAPVAAAVELLHTASLVHDDIIDESTTRRGSATLNAIAGSRTPILVGDYIFAKSALTAVAGRNLRVMDAFATTLMEICEGELREVLSTHQWPQTIDEYYRRIACKTASLFRLSSECGGILSGVCEESLQALSSYGYNLGMAFQVVDDVLDFAGDEKLLGKPVGGDLRQGTVTLPVLLFLDGSSDGLVQRVIAGSERDETAVRDAIQMVIDSPAIERCYAVAREFVERAIGSLESLPENKYRRALLGLANHSLGRLA